MLKHIFSVHRGHFIYSTSVDKQIKEICLNLIFNHFKYKIIVSYAEYLIISITHYTHRPLLNMLFKLQNFFITSESK